MVVVNLWSRQAGALALADADAASNAYRNESRDQSKQNFLHWSSPFFHAHARHTFVLRCTVGRPPKPMVHRLRGRWGTSKGTVSLGTQLRGVRSKTCGRRLPLGRREAGYSTTTNSGATTIRPAT